MGNLRDYHHNWLAAHPNRSEEWLREKLRDGFDIHHLDGNHDNDDAENLVLIEGLDHMRLHGIKRTVRYVTARRDRVIQRNLAREAVEARVYQDAADLKRCGVNWIWKSLATRYKDLPGSPKQYAKRYATREGKPWPI